MNIGILFWMLWVIGLIFGVWSTWPGGYRLVGGNILLWVLLFIIGWKVFGPLIQ